MEDLGYNTRGPLLEKLKNLLNEVQSNYEAFLDAQRLFNEGEISDREFFIRLGEFVKIYSSLGFLTVKVIIELDKAIGKEKIIEKTGPSISPASTIPQVTSAKESILERRCNKCNAKVPEKAKFCIRCGAKQ
jgi:hypothetical protein